MIPRALLEFVLGNRTAASAVPAAMAQNMPPITFWNALIPLGTGAVVAALFFVFFPRLWGKLFEVELELARKDDTKTEPLTPWMRWSLTVLVLLCTVAVVFGAMLIVPSSSNSSHSGNPNTIPPRLDGIVTLSGFALASLTDQQYRIFPIDVAANGLVARVVLANDNPSPLLLRRVAAVEVNYSPWPTGRYPVTPLSSQSDTDILCTVVIDHPSSSAWTAPTEGRLVVSSNSNSTIAVRAAALSPGDYSFRLRFLVSDSTGNQHSVETETLHFIASSAIDIEASAALFH